MISGPSTLGCSAGTAARMAFSGSKKKRVSNYTKRAKEARKGQQSTDQKR